MGRFLPPRYTPWNQVNRSKRSIIDDSPRPSQCPKISASERCSDRPNLAVPPGHGSLERLADPASSQNHSALARRQCCSRLGRPWCSQHSSVKAQTGAVIHLAYRLRTTSLWAGALRYWLRLHVHRWYPKRQSDLSGVLKIR